MSLSVLTLVRAGRNRTPGSTVIDEGTCSIVSIGWKSPSLVVFQPVTALAVAMRSEACPLPVMSRAANIGTLPTRNDVADRLSSAFSRNTSSVPFSAPIACTRPLPSSGAAPSTRSGNDTGPCGTNVPSPWRQMPSTPHPQPSGHAGDALPGAQT